MRRGRAFIAAQLRKRKKLITALAVLLFSAAMIFPFMSGAMQEPDAADQSAVQAEEAESANVSAADTAEEAASEKRYTNAGTENDDARVPGADRGTPVPASQETGSRPAAVPAEKNESAETNKMDSLAADVRIEDAASPAAEGANGAPKAVPLVDFVEEHVGTAPPDTGTFNPGSVDTGDPTANPTVIFPSESYDPTYQPANPTVLFPDATAAPTYQPANPTVLFPDATAAPTYQPANPTVLFPDATAAPTYQPANPTVLFPEATAAPTYQPANPTVSLTQPANDTAGTAGSYTNSPDEPSSTATSRLEDTQGAVLKAAPKTPTPSPSSSKTPKTGDSPALLFWSIALLAASSTILILTVKMSPKKRK